MNRLNIIITCVILFFVFASCEDDSTAVTDEQTVIVQFKQKYYHLHPPPDNVYSIVNMHILHEGDYFGPELCCGYLDSSFQVVEIMDMSHALIWYDDRSYQPLNYHPDTSLIVLTVSEDTLTPIAQIPETEELDILKIVTGFFLP